MYLITALEARTLALGVGGPMLHAFRRLSPDPVHMDLLLDDHTGNPEWAQGRVFATVRGGPIVEGRRLCVYAHHDSAHKRGCADRRRVTRRRSWRRSARLPVVG